MSSNCVIYRCFLLSLLTISAGYDLSGQTNQRAGLQQDYQLNIDRINEHISIDGDLKELVWQESEVATNFWMSYPVDHRRADDSIQTEVMMAFDDHFLYVAAVCHGGGPYIIPSLKRDNPDFWRGDAFAIVLDPINERTNGVNFGTNPAGVQTDAQVTGQTGRRSSGTGNSGRSGINGAWDNKWYVYTKSYADRWTLEMAIPFKTLRYNEGKIWGINFIRGEPKTNSYHTWSPVPVQFRGVDLGYTGSLLWKESPPKSKGNISLIPYLLGSSSKDFEEGDPTDQDFRWGLDAKVAVNSNLNLDVTINPDFSQVEVDEQVTNLTTFNTRFPEKRLFFLENADLFENFGIPPMRPFFSRRIGLDEDNNTIPILFGARLSGNLTKDLRMGLMNMQTKASPDIFGQNYTSLAIHQRVFGRSVVKGYFHNRQAYTENEFQSTDYNRTGGLQIEFRSNDGKWRSQAGYGKAFSPNYQGKNHFLSAEISYDGRHISAYSNFAGAGDHYFTDVGFIPRLTHYDASRDTTLVVGFYHWFTRLGYSFYPENQAAIIRHEVELRNSMDRVNDGELIRNDASIQYNISFQNTSSLGLDLSHEEINLLFPFDFTDGAPLPAGRYNFERLSIMYQSDQRRFFHYEAGFSLGSFYNGNRVEYMLEAKYRAQPWGNFGLRFVYNDLDFPDPYGDERLFLIGPRLEFSFSRDLFWTTFLQYNTQSDNFNINSRFQWRFQPLSDLFIVYTDNYAVEQWGPKNRALVLKLNYWLNL
jgi:hypothetical protein